MKVSNYRELMSEIKSRVFDKVPVSKRKILLYLNMETIHWVNQNFKNYFGESGHIEEDKNSRVNFTLYNPVDGEVEVALSPDDLNSVYYVIKNSEKSEQSKYLFDFEVEYKIIYNHQNNI